MGYTFTFGDIEKICKALNISTLATGTAKRVAQQLGFATVKEMDEFLKRL